MQHFIQYPGRCTYSQMNLCTQNSVENQHRVSVWAAVPFGRWLVRVPCVLPLCKWFLKLAYFGIQTIPLNKNILNLFRKSLFKLVVVVVVVVVLVVVVIIITYMIPLKFQTLSMVAFLLQGEENPALYTGDKFYVAYISLTGNTCSIVNTLL